jgi:hypothetical protein
VLKTVDIDHILLVLLLLELLHYLAGLHSIYNARPLLFRRKMERCNEVVLLQHRSSQSIQVSLARGDLCQIDIVPSSLSHLGLPFPEIPLHIRQYLAGLELARLGLGKFLLCLVFQASSMIQDRLQFESKSVHADPPIPQL